MGVETALILAWKCGTRRPDEKQWQMLSDLLSFDSGVDLPKPNRGFVGFYTVKKVTFKQKPC
jgi:hypothetical protein